MAVNPGYSQQAGGFGLSPNNPSASLRFPNFNISEEDKGESYHKQYVEAITNYSINSSYDMGYATMNESYEFYDGTQSGEEFNFLQEAEDGEVLPAVWINYNRIKPKVDLILGELDRKGYDIRVRAINKEAVVRKVELKEDLRVDMRMQPVAQSVEQTFNVPMGSNPNLPSNEQELDLHFENFQEASEVLMEYALKYLDKKYRWRYQRIALMRDILIAGRCFVKCEIVNGIPTMRRIDPRNMIFDINATDDFLSDSTFFGEVRYMGIADAAQHYGLTEKEITAVYNSYRRDSRFAATNLLVDTSKGSMLTYFKWDRGELRVLVLTAVWQDYKKLKKKFSTDKFGGEHVKNVSDKKQDKQKGNFRIEGKLLKAWRQGTLIGGKLLVDWGEMPNQVRSIDDWFDSDSPYIACVPNYINRNSVSKVHLLKALQKLKNISLYNVQLAMARAGGKGFIYDVSQIPDEYDLKTMMKYLKTTGIAFIDSRKDGIPAQYNQFSPIDQTISDGITRYIEVSVMVDREMDAISGINEARQGFQQGASQAVGVTQSALFQSSLATETLFSEFQIFASNIWSHLGGQVKLAWANKEKFVPIIGETGINFLEEDINLELDDYGVFIEEINPSIQDQQMFQELVITALQGGQIGFVESLKLLREKDVTKGIREFEKAYNKQQEMMQQQQEAQAQAEHEREMAGQERMLQQQQNSAETANQGRLQVEGVKGENDVNKELVKQQGDARQTSSANRAKLQDTALKGKVDLKGKQLDGIMKQQLEKMKPKPSPSAPTNKSKK